jgi:TonB-dependent receptor
MNHPDRSVFSRLLRTATSLFLVLTALSLNAADAAGRLIGTVNSKSTGNALQGALVQLPALNRSALTDNTGTFTFFDVPAGENKVAVSYSGFEDQTQSIPVAAGAVAIASFVMNTTDLVTLEKFTVSSVREGQALAITEQRNASNVKTVAAMDEWGVLPTQNVGELAMRMPGVSFTVDTDDNLINGVSIRGQPGNFTRLNIDGMASTGVGGDGRNATLYSFSGAQYEQIEIISGQTPDKRADSIGGQLNLITASPLAMKENRRIGYNVSARWAPPFSDRTRLRADHPLHPVASINYQEVFSVLGGSRNLGISLVASYMESVNPIANNTMLYRNATDDVVPGYDYADFYGINHRGVTGLSFKADYRYSSTGSLSFGLLYNEGAEPYYERTKINPFANSTTATLDANGVPTGTGAVMPGFTKNLTTIRAVASSVMSIETDHWSFYSQNPTATLTGKNNFGRLKLNYGTRYSYTHWDSGSGANQQGGALLYRTVTPIGFTLDNSNLDGRVFAQTSGANIFDAANYRNTTSSTNWRFDKRKTLADTTEFSARFDATYDLPTSFAMSLKSGFDFSRRVVAQGKGKDRRWLRVANAPALTGGLVPLTRFEEVNLASQRLPLFSPDSVNAELSNPALWIEDVEYAAQRPYISRRTLIETVPAYYAQGQATIKGLTILGGLRTEQVDTSAFTYFKRLATSTTVEPDPVKRAALDYQGGTMKGSNAYLFPSLHLAYAITANLKARASYSTSYGRPTISQLSPTPVANDTLLTVSAGNANLKPQLAENYDVKLEYAFKSNGIVSVGYFKKSITDYISPSGVLLGKIGDGPNNGYDGLYNGYDYYGFTNMGSALVNGLEFDYRQRLSFLPGYLRGITVSANYTVLKTEGKFNGTTDLGSNDVPGFIPRTGNVRLLYNYNRFGASVSANYTSNHLFAFVAPGSSGNIYRQALTMINTGLTYKLRPNLTAYIDVSNVFQKGPVRYTYMESRIRSLTNGARTLSVGVSGQF